MADDLMTVSEFLESRPTLPEQGQWAELEAGRVTFFEPADVEHGTVVLNLSKALAGHAAASGGAAGPVFRLGLRTTERTVRFPAASYVRGGGLFAAMDAPAVDEAPCWVIEIASTPDRRRVMTSRADEYLDWGVELVWVVDPVDKVLHALRGGWSRQYGEQETAEASPVEPDFQLTVADLFREPESWTGTR